MPSGRGVWGIDIGQCGLKALRCTIADDGETIVADAFDFIEYPKILSQPDADPNQLIRDALSQFMSRNSLAGSQVGISISGQSGLARFIKLPPVESKKIPDIVKYEARQQIPFALEDVVWDYQQMPGGSEEDGFTMETEVGLFAMRRDQLFTSIQPLVDAEIELNVIQLTPLCIYNTAVYDILTDVPAPSDYDPDEPPESVVILSMGTDTSDLVVTNGYRVWQRSVPIGGNHFTKQLMNEMKLTFAKAEHLKRNAQEAENPKAVFQAMRSTFSDLVTEVQRSIGYFHNIDRTAKIKRIVVLGNAAKLTGLPQYLAKRLEYDVTQLSSFNRLSGPSVVNAPAFQDNLLSFAVCYGLCLQGLGKAKLSTNLIPREIVRSRIIRQKKPWVAGVVGVVLLGFAFNYLLNWNQWNAVQPDTEVGNVSWQQAETAAKQLSSTSSDHVTENQARVQTLENLSKLGEAAVSIADGRLLWLELITAINQALPAPNKADPNEELTLENLAQRPEIFIDRVDSKFFSEEGAKTLQTWFETNGIGQKYADTLSALERKKAGNAGAVDTTEPPPETAADESATADGDLAVDEPADEADQYATDDGADAGAEFQPPTGAGTVVEIRGHHFHNRGTTLRMAEYVRSEFLARIADEDSRVSLRVIGLDGQPTVETFTYKELGIQYPVVVHYEPTNWRVPDPNRAPDVSAGRSRDLGEFGAPQSLDDDSSISVLACEFIVQFCWTEKRASERMLERLKPAGGDGEQFDDLAVNR